MTKWVYGFGSGSAEWRGKMRDLLGGKGAGLAEMSGLGLPLPPGFAITTEICTRFYANGKSYPSDLEGQVADGLAGLGARFGDADNPLLVTVRSGARVSMPGMMDTVLNLGRKSADERFAYDSYRRFIQMYGQVVLGITKSRLPSGTPRRRRKWSYAVSKAMIDRVGKSVTEHTGRVTNFSRKVSVKTDIERFRLTSPYDTGGASQC